MRRLSATVVSSCASIQKVHASTSAALASRQVPDKWAIPAAANPAMSKWSRPEGFTPTRPASPFRGDPSSSRSSSTPGNPQRRWSDRDTSRPSTFDRSPPQRSTPARKFGARQVPRPTPTADRVETLREAEGASSKVTAPPETPRGFVKPVSLAIPAMGSAEDDARVDRRSRHERHFADKKVDDVKHLKRASHHHQDDGEADYRKPRWGQVQTQQGEASKKKKKTKGKPKEKQVVLKDVYIPSAVSVGNLARLLGVTPTRLDDVMHEIGLDGINPGQVLQSDDASLIAMHLQFNPIVDDAAAFDLYPEPEPANRDSIPPRPPIVTIMGHVDHGKTTLLDTLRSASVAQSESGGITQHIGAFSVPFSSLSVPSPADKDKTVTFLDTPGHAAFSAMRARGANVTDIIVLVVAADDGVMPQTREVIGLARQEKERGGNVQMIVAINKCDKPGVDVNDIKTALLSEGVELEEFGGDIPCVQVSGLTGMGLDTLMETIVAVAEISDLRAERDLRAHGHILEAKVEKGRGPVATVLVSRGTLSKGDCIAAGYTWAKVRQMTDDKGKAISVAYPGQPVTVAGWKDLPHAGDEVLSPPSSTSSESEVKRAVTNRIRSKAARELLGDMEEIEARRNEDRKKRAALAQEYTLPVFNKSGELLSGSRRIGGVVSKNQNPTTFIVEKDGPKELRVVVKADVSGTVEAVVGCIEHIGNKLAKVVVVQQGVGEVKETDVTFASASDAMILGFNVPVSRQIEHLASKSNVPIHVDSVIYRLIEEVTTRVQALLPPIQETKVVGEANVQQLFEISKQKKKVLVAGCRVVNGTLEKHKTVRVVRDGEVIGKGTVTELRHLKSDVLEVRKGMECGMVFDTIADFKEGDLIQAYDTIETPATL